MAAALAGKPAGAKLSITATRNGAEKQFDVTLGSRGAEPAAAPNALPAPAEPATPITTTAPTTTAPRPRLGVRSVPVTEAVQRQNNLASARGAQVVSVIVDSAAERAQIPLGAIITAVGEMKISNPQELAAAIAAVTSDDVELSYVYRGQSLRKKVELGATVAAGDRPNVQVRGRLPLPEDSAAPAAAPSDTSTPADVAQQELKLDGGHSAGEQGDLEQGDRIKTLERQVKQLEERIQSLESELTRQKAAQPAVPE
jgi:membrane-associated protease RseP (regulator of RpoE activity)